MCHHLVLTTKGLEWRIGSVLGILGNHRLDLGQGEWELAWWMRWYGVRGFPAVELGVHVGDVKLTEDRARALGLKLGRVVGWFQGG